MTIEINHQHQYLKGIQALHIKLLLKNGEVYEPLKKKLILNKNLVIPVEILKELHVMIMQLKPWLRARPPHATKWHTQAY